MNAIAIKKKGQFWVSEESKSPDKDIWGYESS